MPITAEEKFIIKGCRGKDSTVVDSILKCHGPKFNTLMSSFPGSLLRSRDPGFSFCVFAQRPISQRFREMRIVLELRNVRNVKCCEI